jgi:thiamine biosynthesis lipoprotein
VERSEFTFTAMGSLCRIWMDAGDAAHAKAVAADMLGEIARIEARYSRYRPDSLLSTINRAAAEGGCIELDEETAGLLDYACACHRKSGGQFDITAGCLRRAWDFSAATPPEPGAIEALLPYIGLARLAWQRPRLSFPQPGMELDFGGIGKEYAVDRAADICRAGGIGHALIDLGGDIRAVGCQGDGAPWPVGIRHPRDGDAALAVLAVDGRAVATSGDYERCIEIGGRRYCHILDPRTGWPVQGLAAVTVVAPSCMVAGSVATIAMLKGDGAPAWLAGLGLPHLWVDPSGRQGGNLLPA